MSEIEPEGREIRADARDVRQDARDVRADTTDTALQDRSVRADVREDVVTEREGSVTGSIRFLKWMVIVLIVLSIGGVIRSFVNQESSEKATTASRRAEVASIRAYDASIQSRDTSEDTLLELRAIVANLEAANEGEPELQNQAIIDALAAVARIEGQLCGGPCPEPEGG